MRELQKCINKNSTKVDFFSAFSSGWDNLEIVDDLKLNDC